MGSEMCIRDRLLDGWVTENPEQDFFDFVSISEPQEPGQAALKLKQLLSEADDVISSLGRILSYVETQALRRYVKFLKSEASTHGTIAASADRVQKKYSEMQEQLGHVFPLFAYALALHGEVLSDQSVLDPLHEVVLSQGDPSWDDTTSAIAIDRNTEGQSIRFYIVPDQVVQIQPRSEFPDSKSAYLPVAQVNAVNGDGTLVVRFLASNAPEHEYHKSEAYSASLLQ